MNVESLSVSHLASPQSLHEPIEGYGIGKSTGVCSLCAYEGAGMFVRSEIMLPTSTQIAEFFKIPSDLMCGPCVALWTKAKVWGRSFLATPGRVLFPLIAAGEAYDPAVKERPLWRDVIGSIDPDVPMALYLTTDPKKRKWPYVRVSQGEEALIYVMDPSRAISSERVVALSRLGPALAHIERLYSMGFSKTSIETSLMSAPRALVELIGARQVVELEREVSPLRSAPEFFPCLLVAQRTEVPVLAKKEKEVSAKGKGESEPKYKEKAAKKKKAESATPALSSPAVPLPHVEGGAEKVSEEVAEIPKEEKALKASKASNPKNQLTLF